MEDFPKISVITPTLNSAAIIGDAVLSVANQSYKNIEHLIIDGLSTDGTIDIVKGYQRKYPHIRVVSEKDNGIYDAMNKGIKLATGEWIYFLGSDDALYNENVFCSLLPYLRTAKLEVIYGNVIFRLSGQKYDGKFNQLKLLKRNICHQGILTRKSVYNKLGKFDLTYRALADWHFNMKWFNDKSIKHLYTDILIAYYFEDGYCFKNPDKNFIKDWNYNITKYFPNVILIIYYLKENRIVRKLT